MIAVVACYFTFEYDMHGFFKLFLIIFLIAAFIDLIANMIPTKNPIILTNGNMIHNDGYQLKQLWWYTKMPNKFWEGTTLYQNNLFSEASQVFEELLSQGAKGEYVYSAALSSFLQAKNYPKAKQVADDFSKSYKLRSDDITSMAIAYSCLGFHKEALELYDKTLYQNPLNKYTLNNKGYTLNLLGKYEDAILLFDQVVKIDKIFPYSYNNRGFSKIKLGNPEEGLVDINHSLLLDKDNSYGYMHLGIYHFTNRNLEKVLELFEKAKKLDHSTHLIQGYIGETVKELEKVRKIST